MKKLLLLLLFTLMLAPLIFIGCSDDKDDDNPVSPEVSVPDPVSEAIVGIWSIDIEADADANPPVLEHTVKYVFNDDATEEDAATGFIEKTGGELDFGNFTYKVDTSGAIMFADDNEVFANISSDRETLSILDEDGNTKYTIINKDNISTVVPIDIEVGTWTNADADELKFVDTNNKATYNGIDITYEVDGRTITFIDASSMILATATITADGVNLILTDSSGSTLFSLKKKKVPTATLR